MYAADHSQSQLIVGEARGPVLEVEGFAPIFRHRSEFPIGFLLRRRPRVIRRPLTPGLAAVQYQGGGALGIGRGKEDAHVAALGCAKQHGALGPGGIHDGAHIIHALL